MLTLGYIPPGGNTPSPGVRHPRGVMSRGRYPATPSSLVSTSVVEVSQGRDIFLLDKQKPTQSYTIFAEADNANEKENNASGLTCHKIIKSHPRIPVTPTV